jgi:hypothetical protein
VNSCRIPVAKVRINFVVDSHWSQLNLIDSVVGRMPVTLIGAMQCMCYDRKATWELLQCKIFSFIIFSRWSSKNRMHIHGIKYLPQDFKVGTV